MSDKDKALADEMSDEDKALADEVLKLFGGREKIQRNFMEKIRERLAVIPPTEKVKALEGLSDLTGLTLEKLKAIDDGHTSEINGDVVEALAYPFGFDIHDGLGELSMSGEQEERWKGIAKEKMFGVVAVTADAGESSWPNEAASIRFFVTCQALESL